MKTNKPKVIEYINQLNNYDTDEIALALMKPEYKMYEEAFQIYKKQNNNIEAIRILISKMENL